MVTNNQPTNQVILVQACSWPVWEGSLLQKLPQNTSDPCQFSFSWEFCPSEKKCNATECPGPSICYTWGLAWSNLNCPCPTMGRRDQEETQEVLVLETLWQFWVSSMWVLRDFRSLHVWEFFQTTSIWRFGFIILKIRNDSTHNCGNLSSRRREKKRRREAAGSKKRKKTMFLPLLLF